MPKLPDFSRGLPEPPMLPSSLCFGLNAPGSLTPKSTSGQDMFLDRGPPILDPLAIHRKLLSQQKNMGTLGGPPSSASAAAAGLVNLMGGGSIPPAPSLYEMAALTHELDTQTVTTKVKEILLANNVGQKVMALNKIQVSNVFIVKIIQIFFIAAHCHTIFIFYSFLEKRYLVYPRDQ